MKGQPLADRIDALSIPEPNSGCQLWFGTTNARGYGLVWSNGCQRLAHRMSFQVHKGAIPTGMFVLHKCDTPACVNPEHLFLGTHKDNMDDMRAKGRSSDGRARPKVWGERNGHAKHTEKLILAVKRADGTYAEIAQIYGVSKTTVGYVKRGIQWAHLP